MTDSETPQPVPAPVSVGIPRRKPVPVNKEVFLDADIANRDHHREPEQKNIVSDPEKDVTTTPDAPAIDVGKIQQFRKPFFSLAILDNVHLGPFDRYLPYEQRKRRRTIAALLAGVILALLALIIGLAVGLTRNKKIENLPLPTSHGGPYTGDLTYYAPGLGACGITSLSSDSICAVSHIIFDAAQTGSDPNANPLCGLKLRLRRNDKSVDVTVVDRCVGCKATDIDTTTSVFGDLAEIDQGRVKVQWAWLESAPVNVTNQH